MPGLCALSFGGGVTLQNKFAFSALIRRAALPICAISVCITHHLAGQFRSEIHSHPKLTSINDSYEMPPD